MKGKVYIFRSYRTLTQSGGAKGLENRGLGEALEKEHAEY